MADNLRYRLWNGCEWTFEEIVEELTGLVKHILLSITPDEQIQDAMQEVWLKLFERLQLNPDLLNNTPGLDNPRYNDKQKRSFLAQRLAWDGRDRTWSQRHRSQAGFEICETDLFGPNNCLRKNPYSLDTLEETHALSTQWVEEVDVRVDFGQAAETYLKSIHPRYLPKYAMALLCLWHDIPFAAGALVIGKAPNTMSEAAADCRQFIRYQLSSYAQ